MQNNDFQNWLKTSYLSGGNASYIEELYEEFLKDPESVDHEWRQYFQSLPAPETHDVSHADIRQHFIDLAKQPNKIAVSYSRDVVLERKQERVERLIEAYRAYGHLAAKIDPLGSSRPAVPELDLNYHDLSSADFPLQFRAPELMGTPTSNLAEIVARLQTIYCQHIGYEYMYIRDPEERKWIQQRIEKAHFNFTAEDKRRILQELVAADGLEKYLSTKYVGQKRFSLEGGDALIPMLQKILHQGSEVGVKSVVIGMAHRGRLNVLVNVVGQSPEELFQEFEGKKDYGMTSGDVKYHLGFSSDIKTANGSMHVSLAFNPSHLEIIAPVALGSVRARQERRHDEAHNQVLPILMHGDASFSGQGVVMETLNMSQINAFTVGGSIHIVINNQVGFTTNPIDSRSSLYCTDIAKMIEAPVFHVNGDDAESTVFVAQLAAEYRHHFHKDCVIDLVCYRRLGHNEADEPAATQPLMYQFIRQHSVPYEVYLQQLIKEKVMTAAEGEEMVKDYRDLLDQGRRVVQLVQNPSAVEHPADWSPYMGQEWSRVVDTTLSWDKINRIGKELDHLPENFELQRQVGLMMTARSKMYRGELPLDWGCAETLAYASLLTEGYPIRICGQDSCRGTFGHRHAVLHDYETDERYIPLQHLNKNQASFKIYDSFLSEEAAMGFEYGYAATDPKTLTIWEAQFGDFANGAQVIIDQFMSSAEQKWRRLCGLVLFLPHGYEGAGPEHSSARLERYLQLCAENNMQVCVPTTPAQHFHMLRRQMLRPFRTPLIVMTPKSLLRNKLAVSSLEDLATGKFKLMIPEIDSIDAAKTQRIIFCNGKVYYDLLTKRRENNQNDVAIVRIEQLYPFPMDELKAELARYKNAKEIIWCQEEPQNQGAWFFVEDLIRKNLAKNQTLTYVGRKASASPAAGYSALHLKQQTELVNAALE